MSNTVNPSQTNNPNILDSNPQTDSASPMLTQPLTLIVATTPIASTTTAAAATTALTTRLGIGNAGTLPWPRIKSDMSFFARVTSRPPPTTTTPKNDDKGGIANAIIMGRKTYYSLPPKLRPLAKRINTVITRDGSGGPVEGEVMRELKLQREKREKTRNEKGLKSEEDTTDAVVAGSLEAAIKELTSLERREVGKIFVIGGAEIYASALRLSAQELGRGMRIVMTKILRRRKDGESTDSSVGEVPGSKEGFIPVGGYDCDTFFPIDDFSEALGWREATAAEVSRWVGEEVNPDWKEEGEVATKVVGYERLLGESE